MKPKKIPAKQESVTIKITESIDLSCCNVREETDANGNKVTRATMVLIQGGTSKNGNRYGLPVLEQLDSLIDSQPKMFTNHLAPGVAKFARAFQDWAGTIESHYVDGNQVVAEVVVHDDGLAKRMREAPAQVGASIDVFAKVNKVKENGVDINDVESIEGYNSTDFVLFPSAGGRLLNVGQSMGWEFKTEDENCLAGFCDRVKQLAISEGIITGDTDGITPAKKKSKIVYEDLAAMMKQRQGMDDWWKLKCALDDALDQAGEDDSLTDGAAVKAAMDALIDQFAGMAKAMDLVAMFSDATYERQTEGNPPGKGGSGEDDAMDIKTVAALREAHPELCQKLEAEVLDKTKSSEASQKLEADLKAAKDKAATLEADLTKIKSEKDALEVAAKATSRVKEIDKLLAEAKLPEYAVTETFRKELYEATEEVAKQKIEDRKAVVAAAAKAHGSGNPNPQGFHPRTGDPAPGDTGTIKESLKDDNVAAALGLS